MYSKNWLYQSMSTAFQKTTGAKFSKEEQEYAYSMFNTNEDTAAKIVYYDTVFRFKRNYPKFLVSILIQYEFKKMLKETNAPDSIISISSELANVSFFGALKAYCKISY